MNLHVSPPESLGLSRQSLCRQCETQRHRPYRAFSGGGMRDRSARGGRPSVPPRFWLPFKNDRRPEHRPWCWWGTLGCLSRLIHGCTGKNLASVGADSSSSCVQWNNSLAPIPYRRATDETEAPDWLASSAIRFLSAFRTGVGHPAAATAPRDVARRTPPRFPIKDRICSGICFNPPPRR